MINFYMNGVIFILNFFNDLNDSLEDAKDKFMDTLEDFKDLVENKVKYNKIENTLEDYFQNEGKEIYKELTKLDMNHNAYFFVTRDKFLNSTIHVCNGTTKSGSKSCFTGKNIEPGIVFTINDGKMNIDEKLTKECIDLLNSHKSKISDTGFLKDIYTGKLNTNTYFKMKEAKDDILKKYAKNTADKGNLYMIQNQDHSENCIYTILEISNNGKDLTYFSVLETELPKGAHIDAIMRYENGKYVLDRESYQYIKSEVTNKANELMEKQNKELESYKVENEIYYVIDTTSDTVYLTRRGDKKIFEEPNISKEILQSVSNGHILRYVDGEYVWDLELTEKSLNPDIEFDFDHYKE